jgi:hypothetical protein
MREFEADLVRISRASRILAAGFWCCTIFAAAVFGFVLLYWLPRHHV